MLTGTVKSDPLWPKTSLVFGALGIVFSIVLFWDLFVSHPVRNLTESELHQVSGVVSQAELGRGWAGKNKPPLKVQLGGVPSSFL